MIEDGRLEAFAVQAASRIQETTEAAAKKKRAITHCPS